MLYNRAKYHSEDQKIQRQFEEFRAQNLQFKADYASGRVSGIDYENWLTKMSQKFKK